MPHISSRIGPSISLHCKIGCLAHVWTQIFCNDIAQKSIAPASSRLGKYAICQFMLWINVQRIHYLANEPCWNLKVSEKKRKINPNIAIVTHACEKE